MKVAIIDDLSECRKELSDNLYRYVYEHCAKEWMPADLYISGEDFLSTFVPETYDVIFIDQYMCGLSGLETARKIREQDSLVPLIFVTTSRDHAVDSFSVRACGYLVKPYAYEDFKQTMQLAGIRKIRGARFIRMDQEKILLRDILWCDHSAHYSQIHIDNQRILRYRTSFSQLTHLLAPYSQFLACYKGCLVNMERIARLGQTFFIMDDGTQIPFALRNKKNIEAQYYAWLFQREREDGLL